MPQQDFRSVTLRSPKIRSQYILQVDCYLAEKSRRRFRSPLALLFRAAEKSVCISAKQRCGYLPAPVKFFLSRGAGVSVGSDSFAEKLGVQRSLAAEDPRLNFGIGVTRGSSSAWSVLA